MSRFTIVGKDYKVWDIVSALMNTSSFTTLIKKLPDIAYSLGIKPVVIKTLKQQLLIGLSTPTEALSDVLENWIAQEGDHAKLTCLLATLEQLNLIESKEILLAAFSNKKCTSSKQFAKPPIDVQNFLDVTSTVCKTVLLLYTLDVQKTCQKIQETVKGYVLYDFSSFLQVDYHTVADDNDNQPIFVVATSLSEVKYVVKCREIRARLTAIVDSSIEKALEDLVTNNTSFAQVVKIGFDKMLWQELTLGYQYTLHKEIEKQLGMSIEEDDLCNIIQGQTLLNIMIGKRPKLFKDTLPKSLPFYINRTLRSRNIVSQKILMHETSQIFVFSNITRPELSNLVKTKSTENSTYIVLQKEIDCQFIVLDCHNHFNRICHLTDQPVHWLSLEREDKLIWVKSKNDISLLQDFIEVEIKQMLLTEKSFLQMLNMTTNSPVCIVDSPGMGKSILLAELGREMKRNWQSKDIIFLSIFEFVEEVKTQRKFNSEIFVAIKMALENLACETDLGKLYLAHKLGNTVNEQINLQMELLLDGLDEVDETDKPLTDKILNILQSLISIRIWVTARPHMLQHLEVALNTLGFNLLAFSEEDQLHFLTSYWINESYNHDEREKIWNYARRCVKTVKSNLGIDEKEIIGIPLQCFLIGEVYQDLARSYAESTVPVNPSLQVQIFGDVYSSLLETKMRKYRLLSNDILTVDEMTLLEMHQKLSLDLLFPDNNLLSHVVINLEEMLKLGVMEFDNNMTSPRFLHRTIAEYLAARFVVDSLRSEIGWTNYLSKLLFGRILQTKRYWDYDVSTFTTTIPYFINRLLMATAASHDDEAVFAREKLYQYVEQMGRCITPSDFLTYFLRASAQSGYANLFRLLTNLTTKLTDPQRQSIYNLELLLASASQPTLNVFKVTLFHFQKFQTFSAYFKRTLFLTAIKHGRLSIMEYLLNNCGLRSICTEILGHQNTLLGTYKCSLLQHCLISSGKNDEGVIEQKIQIISLLLGIDESLLEKEDSHGRTPLLSENIHVQLTLELIKLGADTLRKDENGNTVLHFYKDRSSISANNYLLLLKSMVAINLEKLMRTSNKTDDTPLGTIFIHRQDPLLETLDIFKRLGADFSHINNKGESILSIAVENRYSTESLRTLTKFGASLSWKGNGLNLLHLAAKNRCIEAIEFLVTEKEFDVNGKSDKGLTALDYTSKHMDKWSNSSRSYEMLVKFGGKLAEEL